MAYSVGSNPSFLQSPDHKINKKLMVTVVEHTIKTSKTFFQFLLTYLEIIYIDIFYNK